MPRLIFSKSNHLNTDISDEDGHLLYTVTTVGGFNKVTTITKYMWNGPTGLPQTLGIIEWHSFTGNIIRFQGKEIRADVMLEKRTRESGRYFVGPDGHSYKWKIRGHVWLKPAHSGVKLVRFHPENIGILKEFHRPYLGVSSEVVPMLDHIVLMLRRCAWSRL